MTAPPVTRSLTHVLRAALNSGGDQVRLLLGEFGTADPSNAYCNVVLQGQAVRVPMLSGVNDAPGGAAYLLATNDFILCIGSVRA